MKLKKIFAIFISVFLCFAIALPGCVTNEGGAPSGDDSGSTIQPDDGETDTGDEETPGNGGGSAEEGLPIGDIELPQSATAAYSAGKAGYYAEYLGYTDRILPEVSDGGLGRYPSYGVPLSGADEAERQAIIDENRTLISAADSEFGAGTYDSMDAQGNLYLNGAATGAKLYKHSAADGMYGGNLSDAEPAVIKRLTYSSGITYGNFLTGLYAPAGEVIKVEISAGDLQKTGGLKVFIGQYFPNYRQNNIWAARELNRMPLVGNTMAVEDEVAYVGSYLGGPLYIATQKECGEFSVTISGAVAYSHYILGYTTEEEFERNKNSTAPYFDLEVWGDSVRHSGPKQAADMYSYEELGDAAILWDKISRVSRTLPSGSRTDGGIYFIYDPFIAAGSMVALVGQGGVNCPVSTMTSALDAYGAINSASDGMWGSIHEYNHHFQRYGISPGDEVTNNAVSLVEYSLFTRISSGRRQGNTKLSGWNRFTDPAWALAQLGSDNANHRALSGYVNLLYSFGQQAFVNAVNYGNGSGGADMWYKSVSEATGYDMTWYFTELLGCTLSEDIVSQYSQRNNPVYVPVASVFQTGAGYIKDGRYAITQTIRPYVIVPGVFTFDLEESIVLPQGFTAHVKSLSQPSNGSVVKNADGTYTYTPASEGDSGTMYARISVAKDDGALEVEDVVLAIEFEQSYANSGVTRTVYSYDNIPYSTATEAYGANYDGYSAVTVSDNVNRVQNGNSEIWEPGLNDNAVMELSGKFSVGEAGTYRIALRGRYYAALYISLDGENYTLAGKLENAPRTDQYFANDPDTYTDIRLEEGQYVYYRQVLLIRGNGTYGGSDAYIGMGCGKVEGGNVTISHVNNAVNRNYEPATYESDYYYPRKYEYNYTAEDSGKGSLVSCVYTPWEGYPVDRLFDGDDSNYIHSAKGSPVNADNPFEVTVDLGSVGSYDMFTIFGAAARQYQPKSFALYGGTTVDNMQLLASVTDAERTGDDIVVSFGERDIRYYRLVVTDTFDSSSNKYIAYRYAVFTNSARLALAEEVSGSAHLSPDVLTYSGVWQRGKGLATFGHGYVSSSGSAKLNFSGALFCLIGRGSFSVEVDGVDFGTFNCEEAGGAELIFSSGPLPGGGHTVGITALGELCIDSIAIK